MNLSADALLIDFTAGGNSVPCCVAGWSTPEPDGTWTTGPVSRLTLPAPQRPGSYALVFRLRPMTAGDRLPAQRLLVRVNDVPLAEFRITRRTTRACVVPWEVVQRAPELSITLGLPDAARPAEHGQGDDRRLLGVSLSSLHLHPDLFETWLDGAALADGQAAPGDPAAAAAAARLPLHDLMLKFESLGQNCEFGLVQRRGGAEPLGLLRFSSTPLPRLLDALDAGFDGMGAADAIQVDLDGSGREYMVHDTRYGFMYHAWVNAGEMSAADVARREARRVPFLVRKLVEDLEAADKLFVFKGMGAVSAEEAFPLALAIRRYGPNTLLLATLADAAHPPGTVQFHAPGFMIGYLDRFAPGENAHDLSFDCWVQVCRAAHALRLSLQGAAP